MKPENYNSRVFKLQRYCTFVNGNLTCGMMASPLIARTSSKHIEHLKSNLNKNNTLKISNLLDCEDVFPNLEQVVMI
jgi:hypothetical protein